MLLCVPFHWKHEFYIWITSFLEKLQKFHFPSMHLKQTFFIFHYSWSDLACLFLMMTWALLSMNQLSIITFYLCASEFDQSRAENLPLTHEDGWSPSGSTDPLLHGWWRTTKHKPCLCLDSWSWGESPSDPQGGAANLSPSTAIIPVGPKATVNFLLQHLQRWLVCFGAPLYRL